MGGAVVSKNKSDSSLDFEIISALKLKKEHDSHNGDVSILDTMIQDFEQLHFAIARTKRAYISYAETDGSLHQNDLVKAIQSIYEEATAEQVKLIFNITEEESNRMIGLHEFLTVLVVALTTNTLPTDESKSSEIYEKYQKCKDSLGIIVSVYLLFDSDCNGYIEKDNVQKVLDDPANHESKHQNHKLCKKVLRIENWNHLTWDANNRLDFQHFVMAYADWVLDAESARYVRYKSAHLQVPALEIHTHDDDDPSRPQLGHSQTSFISFQDMIKKALRRRKEEDKHLDHKMSFERILLKFDKMHRIISSAKLSYDKFRQKQRDGLSRSELVQALHYLHQDINDHIIEQIFEFSDVNTNRYINFKEFLTALTVAVTLYEPPATDMLKNKTDSMKIAENLREMLKLIVSAYLLFDPECDGFIELKNIESLLLVHHASHTAHHLQHSLAEKVLSTNRWNEMDWDGHGRIDFAEFTYTFSGWAVDIDTADNGNTGTGSAKTSNKLITETNTEGNTVIPSSRNEIDNNDNSNNGQVVNGEEFTHIKKDHSHLHVHMSATNEVKQFTIEDDSTINLDDDTESNKQQKIPSLAHSEHQSKSERVLRSDLLRALKTKQEEDNRLDKAMSLERILLQFDKMNQIFRNTKEGFNKFATSEGYLTRENLIQAVQYIHSDASSHRIGKIFDLSDVDESRLIDYKEFLTALTMAETLNELSSSPRGVVEPLTSELSPSGTPVTSDTNPSYVNDSPSRKGHYKDLKEALGLIISAYLLFDPDCEGHFNRNTPHKNTSFLNESRWNEMDWDGNGCVDFPEFACTFVGWIMDVDEEEEWYKEQKHAAVPPLPDVNNLDNKNNDEVSGGGGSNGGVEPTVVAAE